MTLNVRKDKGIGDVPYPSPNADAGGDDDELSEEAVEDEWNQSIVLRADKNSMLNIFQENLSQQRHLVKIK